MSRIRLTAATVGGLALLCSAFVTPAPAATKRSCPENDRFIQHVRTTNLSCKTGLAIAFKWARTDACFRGDGDVIGDRATACTVRSFRCTPRKTSDFSVDVTCKRGSRTVRFTDRV